MSLVFTFSKKWRVLLLILFAVSTAHSTVSYAQNYCRQTYSGSCQIEKRIGLRPRGGGGSGSFFNRGVNPNITELNPYYSGYERLSQNYSQSCKTNGADKTISGALIGTAIGAVTGFLIGQERGALIGGGIGAGLGGLAGYSEDRVEKLAACMQKFLCEDYVYDPENPIVYYLSDDEYYSPLQAGSHADDSNIRCRQYMHAIYSYGSEIASRPDVYFCLFYNPNHQVYFWSPINEAYFTPD